MIPSGVPPQQPHTNAEMELRGQKIQRALEAERRVVTKSKHFSLRWREQKSKLTLAKLQLCGEKLTPRVLSRKTRNVGPF